VNLANTTFTATGLNTSLTCFLKGTNITKLSNDNKEEQVPIENLKIGDTLKTVKGSTKVKDIFLGQYDGKNKNN
jgi:hypothetical protein